MMCDGIDWTLREVVAPLPVFIRLLDLQTTDDQPTNGLIDGVAGLNAEEQGYDARHEGVHEAMRRHPDRVPRRCVSTYSV